MARVAYCIKTPKHLTIDRGHYVDDNMLYIVNPSTWKIGVWVRENSENSEKRRKRSANILNPDRRHVADLAPQEREGAY